MTVRIVHKGKGKGREAGRRNWKRAGRRLLPLMLALALTSTLLPLSAFASSSGPNAASGSQPTASVPTGTATATTDSGTTVTSTPASSVPMTQGTVPKSQAEQSAPRSNTPSSLPVLTTSQPVQQPSSSSPADTTSGSKKVELTKTGPASASPGDTIAFTISVHARAALTGVSVSDPLTGLDYSIGSMASDEWVTVPSDLTRYTIPENFPGSRLVNFATARGNWVGGVTLDSASCAVAIQQARIAIQKTIQGQSAPNWHAGVGDNLVFKLKVSNTGNVSLDNVTVSDPLTGFSSDVGTLAPGHSETELTSYTVKAQDPDPLVNTASASGEALGELVSAHASIGIRRDKASLDITKTGPETAFPGEQVEYHIRVVNTGDSTLSPVNVDDEQVGFHHAIASLKPGQCWEHEVDYTIPSDLTGTEFTNTAAASVKSDETGDVSDTASWNLRLTARPAPGIQLVKEGPSTARPGDTVTYKFTVTNCGGTALTNVKVIDPMLGGEVWGLPRLDAGESREFTRTYRIDGHLKGETLENQACASACYKGGKCESKSGCRTAIDHEKLEKPALNIDKDGPCDAWVGGRIEYHFKVRNTGNVKLENVVLDDALLGISGMDLGSLKLGQCREFELPYTVGANDPEWLVNEASVKGESEWGAACASDSCETLVKKAAIGVEKTTDVTCARVGDTIRYLINVTNTGNVWLWNVHVEDPMFGGITSWAPALPPRGDYSLLKTYTVRDADPGTLINNVTACAVPTCGCPVRATGSATVRIIHPGIALVKTASTDCARVGDVITYSFAVKNTGDCKLTNVAVTDSMVTVSPIGDLDPGEERTVTAGHTVADADPAKLVNKATVSGTPECGPAVTGDGSASVSVIHPAVELTKSAPALAAIGDKITYSYKVKNTGDSKLTNITVSDDLLGPIGPFGDLEPGAEQTITVDYTVKASDSPAITNTATVTATPACGPDVTDNSRWTVNITGGLPGGRIQITKVNATGDVTEGDTVDFTITVKHAGATQIEAPVALTDSFDGALLKYKSATVSPDSVGSGTLVWNDLSSGNGLATGESASVTVTFQAAGEGTAVNSATVSAHDANGALLSGSATANVTIAAAVAPGTPTTPSVVGTVSTRTTSESGTLPFTGDRLSGFFVLAFVLIPLGLAMMALAFVTRRRSLKKAAQ